MKDAQDLQIRFHEDKKSYQPKEAIDVGIQWDLGQPAERLELRLLWYTRGKGEQDVNVVDTVIIEQPAEHGVGCAVTVFHDLPEPRPFLPGGQRVGRRSQVLEIVADLIDISEVHTDHAQGPVCNEIFGDPFQVVGGSGQLEEERHWRGPFPFPVLTTDRLGIR